MLCRSKEKLYAHYIGQASWAGARIIQEQWTPQALKLYDLLILTFSENGKLADLEALGEKSGLSSEDFDQVLYYSSQVSVLMETRLLEPSLIPIKVLHNLVNYKSFGFTKIVPRVSEEKFAAVVEQSANAANAISLWNEVSS